MWKYIARRLLGAALVLWLVSVFVFITIRALPGDALLVKLGDAGQLSEDKMEAARTEMGLDRPVFVAYFEWAGGFLKGDFGESLIYDDVTVSSRMQQALPPTIELAILSSLISIPLSLALGSIAALRQDTWADYPIRVLAVAGISVPSFVVATLLLLFTSRQLGYVPPFGWVDWWENPLKNAEQIYMPVAILGFGISGTMMRMMRSALLEVLRQDYVRTARAKGLQARTVFFRHSMRNAMVSITTLLGFQIVALISGSLLMEIMFSIPGMGRLTLTAIRERDYPQIMGNTMFFASVVVAANLVTDLAYGLLDPRVTYT
ncbi:MAG: ABC transporter permease [Dehalococcoidia bacterium]